MTYPQCDRSKIISERKVMKIVIFGVENTTCHIPLIIYWSVFTFGVVIISKLLLKALLRRDKLLHFALLAACSWGAPTRKRPQNSWSVTAKFFLSKL